MHADVRASMRNVRTPQSAPQSVPVRKRNASKFSFVKANIGDIVWFDTQQLPRQESVVPDIVVDQMGDGGRLSPLEMGNSELEERDNDGVLLSSLDVTTSEIEERDMSDGEIEGRNNGDVALDSTEMTTGEMEDRDMDGVLLSSVVASESENRDKNQVLLGSLEMKASELETNDVRCSAQTDVNSERQELSGRPASLQLINRYLPSSAADEHWILPTAESLAGEPADGWRGSETDAESWTARQIDCQVSIELERPADSETDGETDGQADACDDDVSSVTASSDDDGERQSYRDKVASHYQRLLDSQTLSSDALILSQAEDSDSRSGSRAGSPVYQAGISADDWRQIDRQRRLSAELRPKSILKTSSASSSKLLQPPGMERATARLKKVRVRRHNSIIRANSEDTRHEAESPAVLPPGADRSRCFSPADSVDSGAASPAGPIPVVCVSQASEGSSDSEVRVARRVDTPTYQSYAAGLLQSCAPRSAAFVRLQGHYTSLERVQRIERATAEANVECGRERYNSIDLRYKSLCGGSAQETRALVLAKYPEESMRELGALLLGLDDAQTRREFLFEARQASQWEPWRDRGLNLRSNALSTLTAQYEDRGGEDSAAGQRRSPPAFSRQLSFDELQRRYAAARAGGGATVATANTGSYLQRAEEAGRRGGQRAMYGYHIDEPQSSYEWRVHTLKRSQSCPAVHRGGVTTGDGEEDRQGRAGEGMNRETDGQGMAGEGSHGEMDGANHGNIESLTAPANNYSSMTDSTVSVSSCSSDSDTESACVGRGRSLVSPRQASAQSNTETRRQNRQEPQKWMQEIRHVLATKSQSTQKDGGAGSVKTTDLKSQTSVGLTREETDLPHELPLSGPVRRSEVTAASRYRRSRVGSRPEPGAVSQALSLFEKLSDNGAVDNCQQVVKRGGEDKPTPVVGLSEDSVNNCAPASETKPVDRIGREVQKGVLSVASHGEDRTEGRMELCEGDGQRSKDIGSGREGGRGGGAEASVGKKGARRLTNAEWLERLNRQKDLLCWSSSGYRAPGRLAPGQEVAPSQSQVKAMQAMAAAEDSKASSMFIQPLSIMDHTVPSKTSTPLSARGNTAHSKTNVPLTARGDTASSKTNAQPLKPDLLRSISEQDPANRTVSSEVDRVPATEVSAERKADPIYDELVKLRNKYMREDTRTGTMVWRAPPVVGYRSVELGVQKLLENLDMIESEWRHYEEQSTMSRVEPIVAPPRYDEPGLSAPNYVEPSLSAPKYVEPGLSSPRYVEPPSYEQHAVLTPTGQSESHPRTFVVTGSVCKTSVEEKQQKCRDPAKCGQTMNLQHLEKHRNQERLSPRGQVKHRGTYSQQRSRHAEGFNGHHNEQGKNDRRAQHRQESGSQQALEGNNDPKPTRQRHRSKDGARQEGRGIQRGLEERGGVRGGDPPGEQEDGGAGKWRDRDVPPPRRDTNTGYYQHQHCYNNYYLPLLLTTTTTIATTYYYHYYYYYYYYYTINHYYYYCYYYHC